MSYLTVPPNPCFSNSISSRQARRRARRKKKHCRPTDAPSIIIIFLSPLFLHCTASGFCFFNPPAKLQDTPPLVFLFPRGAVFHPLLLGCPTFSCHLPSPICIVTPSPSSDSPSLVGLETSPVLVYVQTRDRDPSYRLNCFPTRGYPDTLGSYCQ